MRKQGNCNQNFNSCICLGTLPACVCFLHKHVFCKLLPFLFRCYAYPRKSIRKQGNCNQNFNVMQTKFQSLLLPCTLSACVCFLHKKAFWHVFCFYVYAQYTNRKPCVSKAIAIKISTYCNQNFNSCICLVLCLPAFVFLHKNVFCKLFFLFGCHAVAANCAFARYRQTFVAFITSARYCIGILRFSQCIFVVLQHNKSDFRICFCLQPFNGKKLRL